MQGGEMYKIDGVLRGLGKLEWSTTGTREERNLVPLEDLYDPLTGEAITFCCLENCLDMVRSISLFMI
jgi:hypothetical protein